MRPRQAEYFLSNRIPRPDRKYPLPAFQEQTASSKKKIIQLFQAIEICLSVAWFMPAFIAGNTWPNLTRKYACERRDKPHTLPKLLQ
jgi:hypothetical protein